MRPDEQHFRTKVNTSFHSWCRYRLSQRNTPSVFFLDCKGARINETVRRIQNSSKWNWLASARLERMRARSTIHSNRRSYVCRWLPASTSRLADWRPLEHLFQCARTATWLIHVRFVLLRYSTKACTACRRLSCFPVRFSRSKTTEWGASNRNLVRTRATTSSTWTRGVHSLFSWKSNRWIRAHLDVKTLLADQQPAMCSDIYGNDS